MDVILIVNSHLKRPGNFGVRAQRICSLLEEKNINFMCISRGGGKTSSYTNLSFFSFFARGLNYLRLRLFKNLNHRKIERLIFEFFVIRILKQTIFTNTVVHLWEYSPRIIKFIQDKGGKVVLETPNVTLNYIRELEGQPIYKYLNYHSSQEDAERTAIQASNIVISPSQFVTNYIKSLVPSAKIKTVPFAFPNHNYAITTKPNNPKLKLLFVGNIDYRKGVGSLLKVMEELKDENIELDCLGRMGTIGKEFNQVSLNNVKYHGFADPVPFYKAADVFVFPTWSEGSAKAVYEAMSFGNAVITTNASGSLVDHESEGLIVEPGNHTEIKNAILTLMKDRDLLLEFQTKALQKSKLRQWQDYSADVLSIYRSVI